ncbi:hypothetical protein D3C72_1635200 [compost metagenome]
MRQFKQVSIQDFRCNDSSLVGKHQHPARKGIFYISNHKGHLYTIGNFPLRYETILELGLGNIFSRIAVNYNNYFFFYTVSIILPVLI